MKIRPQQMTVEECAAVQTALGVTVQKAGRVYWTRGNGFFWRPLLDYQAIEPAGMEAPRGAWGGFQHVVPEERDGNSSIGFLMLDELRGYALNQVSHNRRRLISNAAKLMEVRMVRNLAELQEQGFAAYTSFYRRTRYQFLRGRRRKANFDRWAATLLSEPKTMVLGAYGSGGLVAVSVSYWVEGTLFYATYFSHSTALHQGASELMFHALREAAAGTPGIQEVLVRRYQGGNGMDQYYLMRGAKLVWKPARLRLNPAMRWVLKHWWPGKYATLRGTAGPKA